MPRNKKKERFSVDKGMFFAILALVAIGLLMVSSAGMVYSKDRFGEHYFFLKHQFFFGVLPGLLAFYLAQKIDYRFWKKLALPFFVLSVLALVLVFVPGVGKKIYGASRWIWLGEFSFQPSEMLKISLIIYLAAWLEKRKFQVKDFYEGLLPFLAVVAGISFLLVKQPDIGTLGVVILISMSIFFASGARLGHMFLMGAAGASAFLILIKTEAYRMNRLMVFLHPEIDPRGIGYQLNQALLAIGSGGIFGKGLGHSLQKFNYLPEPAGDSIFAIVGEEFGLLGGLVLISLFLFLSFRGFRAARNAPDDFGRLLAVGIVSWISFQAFINISAVSGLIPLTGITLPFISYGGTSIIFLLFASGILLNISKKKVYNS